MEIGLTIGMLVFVPVFLKVTEKTAFVKYISPIALAYGFGILVSLLGIPKNNDLLINVYEISIAISISLLVLASHLDKFRTFIGPVLKAFGVGILSLLTVITIVFIFYGIKMDYASSIMAMLTGVYVGGTPNMNAIGIALEVPEDVVALVNTAEIVFGGIYFLLLITVMKPIFSLFLKKYVPGKVKYIEEEVPEKLHISKSAIEIVKAILLSGLVLGASFGITLLIFGEIVTAALLITLTTLSVIGGQTGFVKRIKLKFETADFFLIIFSFGIATQIDLNEMLNKGKEIYILVGSVFVGTISLHLLFARLFRIDTDTYMISSVAGLYGPAFIAPVANAMKNRELIIYGIALGLLGYIIGNYLGLAVGAILDLIAS